jgi:hypothetical protein
MQMYKYIIKIVGLIFVIFSQNSCKFDDHFIEKRNGNIISPEGIEYVFLAHEGFVCTFGESKFLGKIRGEYPKLHHLGGSLNTGMYSCDIENLDILYRIKPNNEWRTYYRKASLPKIELIPENCIRFEFIRYKKKEYYENNISSSQIHMICNEGLTNVEEIQSFLNSIKKEKSPSEAGLYELITNEDGRLENCYLMGCVYGYFENETNLAISYNVWSFDDRFYSIDTDFGKYVLPIEWLDKLGYKK